MNVLSPPAPGLDLKSGSCLNNSQSSCHKAHYSPLLVCEETFSLLTEDNYNQKLAPCAWNQTKNYHSMRFCHGPENQRPTGFETNSPLTRDETG